MARTRTRYPFNATTRRATVQADYMVGDYVTTRPAMLNDVHAVQGRETVTRVTDTRVTVSSGDVYMRATGIRRGDATEPNPRIIYPTWSGLRGGPDQWQDLENGRPVGDPRPIVASGYRITTAPDGDAFNVYRVTLFGNGKIAGAPVLLGRVLPTATRQYRAANEVEHGDTSTGQSDVRTRDHGRYYPNFADAVRAVDHVDPVFALEVIGARFKRAAAADAARDAVATVADGEHAPTPRGWATVQA